VAKVKGNIKTHFSADYVLISRSSSAFSLLSSYVYIVVVVCVCVFVCNFKVKFLMIEFVFKFLPIFNLSI
jgi:hypothetical protein